MREARKPGRGVGPRRWLALALPAVAALLAIAPASAAKKSEAAVFYTIAKVVVAPSGEATSIEPDSALPAELQNLVRRHAAAMRFEPTTSVVGQAPATTYLQFRGCLVPDSDDGARVALGYYANGPRPLPGPTLQPPNYPREAYRNGLQAEARITLVVQPDGSAIVEDIAYERTRGTDLWDRVLGEWVGTLRYAPEEINGVAIRTRVEVPVQFLLDDGSAKLPKAADSQECLAAREGTGDDDSRPVALDSPVRVVPAG